VLVYQPARYKRVPIHLRCMRSLQITTHLVMVRVLQLCTVHTTGDLMLST
jgi:hypothetical protein